MRGGNEVGDQPHTGYDELDWDAKLEYFFTPDSKLVLAHQSVDQNDIWRTHRTIFGITWEGTSRGNDKRLSYDQDRDLTYLQYHAVNLPGFVEEVHLSLSHHLQSEEEARIRDDNRRDQQGLDVNTLGVSFQLHSPSPVGRWVYGGEYYRDRVDSFARRFNANGTLRTIEVQGPRGGRCHL